MGQGQTGNTGWGADGPLLMLKKQDSGSLALVASDRTDEGHHHRLLDFPVVELLPQAFDVGPLRTGPIAFAGAGLPGSVGIG